MLPTSFPSPQPTPILTRLINYWNAIGIYTKLTFITCLIVFSVQLFWDDVTIYLSYNAYLIMEKFQLWRLVTFAYLHGGFLHIIFNMMALLSLGSMLEKRQGTFHFMWSSWVCLVIASLIHTVFLFGMFRGFGYLLQWYITPGVGYSGVLFSYVVLSIRYYPEARNVCGFSIAPHLMPWLLLLVCQLIMWNVSFMGHLTGILAGYVYFFVLKIPVYRKVVFRMERLIPGPVRRLASFKEMEDNGIDSVDGTNRFQQQQGAVNVFGVLRDRFNAWRSGRAAASGGAAPSGGRRLGGGGGGSSSSSAAAAAGAPRSPQHPQTNSYSNLQDEEDDDELYSDFAGETPASAPQQETQPQQKIFPGEGKRLGSG